MIGRSGGEHQIVDLGVAGSSPAVGTQLALGCVTRRKRPMWWVYVLRSLKDGRRYVGISEDVRRRVGDHNTGRAWSTKGRRPFELIYKESLGTRSEARLRELYFKTAAGRRFLAKTP